MDKLGNIGFVVKNCGVEMKEAAMRGVLGTIAILFKKMGGMVGGIAGMVGGIAVKVGGIAVKFTDFGDKIVQETGNSSQGT